MLLDPAQHVGPVAGVVGARALEPRRPAAHLPGDVPLAAPEGGQRRHLGHVDGVQLDQHVEGPLAEQPHRGRVDLAPRGGQVLAQDRARHQLHHVELRAQHRLVALVAHHPRDVVEDRRERGLDVVLATHVVGPGGLAPARRAPQHQVVRRPVGARLAHQVGQVGGATTELAHLGDPVDPGARREPRGERVGVEGVLVTDPAGRVVLLVLAHRAGLLGAVLSAATSSRTRGRRRAARRARRCGGRGWRRRRRARGPSCASPCRCGGRPPPSRS